MKSSIKIPKRLRHHIWVNHRQKPIDPNKYCSLCRYEYSKRSNYVMHVRKIHKGQFPPQINAEEEEEEDQSLHEMNEENLHEQCPQEKDDINIDRSGNSFIFIFQEKYYLAFSCVN